MRSTAEPLLGLVTVLYNSDGVLPGFMRSLAEQSFTAYRLYVIDNSAQDSGARLAKRLADELGIDARVVFNNANVGVARGNNQGIEMALADGCAALLLANNDTEFEANTLNLLMHLLEEPAVRVVTPKIMYFDDPDSIWYASGSIHAWTLRTPHHDQRKRDAGQFDRDPWVTYAPTCFLLVEASVFAEVGTMDEQYFVYYDDTDFMWRLKKRGMRTRLASNVRVLHKVSSSTGGDASPFSVYYANRNRVYFARKNLAGLQRAIALAYMLGTRVLRSLWMSRTLRARMWLGVRDGFALPVHRHVDSNPRHAPSVLID